MSVVVDIQSRRAARRVDARQLIDNIANGVASLDAQIRSLPFQKLTEQRVAVAERNVTLLRGLLAELRAQIPIEPTGAA